jgi:hypothetical protein
MWLQFHEVHRNLFEMLVSFQRAETMRQRLFKSSRTTTSPKFIFLFLLRNVVQKWFRSPRILPHREATNCTTAQIQLKQHPCKHKFYSLLSSSKRYSFWHKDFNFIGLKSLQYCLLNLNLKWNELCLRDSWSLRKRKINLNHLSFIKVERIHEKIETQNLALLKFNNTSKLRHIDLHSYTEKRRDYVPVFNFSSYKRLVLFKNVNF